jgi:hypothetical protein
VYAQYMDASGLPVIGLNENEADKISVILYPNPVSEISVIKPSDASLSRWELEISDISGRVMVYRI